MNPLGNGNIGSLPVGLKQNIQQVKMMMNNPTAILQQNPMFSQLMQTYKGQDLKSIFYNLAQQKEVSKMHIELIDKIIRDGSDEDMECLRKILIELISDLKYTDYDKYKKIELKLYKRVYGEHLNEELAKSWVASMENKDGTKGEHWTIEQTNQYAENYNKYDFYAVANMMRSDYYNPKLEEATYLQMAKDWLNDKDVGDCKTLKYYMYIVK